MYIVILSSQGSKLGLQSFWEQSGIYKYKLYFFKNAFLNTLTDCFLSKGTKVFQKKKQNVFLASIGIYKNEIRTIIIYICQILNRIFFFRNCLH